jgi:hypothetical protein
MKMLSPDTLIAALNTRGLHFVTGGDAIYSTRRLSPTVILTGLAQQSDARLRMTIIAYLLYQPDLANAIPKALRRLGVTDQITLKLFYTAAVLLQQIHAERLQRVIPRWQLLPDLFSQELGLPQDISPQERLDRLSKLHRSLSGLAANWLGTYQYAAQRLITRLEKEGTWAT